MHTFTPFLLYEQNSHGCIIYTHTYTYMYLYMHTHIYTHIYIHIHIHVEMQVWVTGKDKAYGVQKYRNKYDNVYPAIG